MPQTPDQQQRGHTPGPWQRSGVRRKLGDEDCICVGPDSFSIAFLPIGRRPREQAGAIADANLIAAAPELLDALCALIDMDVAYKRGPVVEVAVEKARAAIARASGPTP